MTAVIPPESRLEAAQIMIEGALVDYCQPEKLFVATLSYDPLCLFRPLVQKIYLELKEPCGEENIADIGHIMRELKTKTEFQSL